jgi:hypothetical protein
MKQALDSFTMMNNIVIPQGGSKMVKLRRMLAMAVVLGWILSANMAGAEGWSSLDSQLWDEVGLGGDASKVQALLDAGAHANIKNLTGAPVLMFADNVEVARILLDRGAEVNARTPEGESILYQNTFWGRREIVELLLARGANVNAKNSDGETPLFIAAYKGWKEIVELLLVKGADVNAKDNTNKTPLYSAAFQGQKDIAALLIAKGAEVNSATNEGVSILSATCVQDAEVVAMLRAAGAKGTPEQCSEEALMMR